MKARSKAAFTLVEIMIVIAIIALIAAIAVPTFWRARKRTQATRVLEDLRLLDNAVEHYALETNKPMGFNPSFGDLKNYIKANTLLYSGSGSDIFGNSYGPYTVDGIPRVSSITVSILSDVVDAGFWSPYN